MNLKTDRTMSLLQEIVNDCKRFRLAGSTYDTINVDKDSVDVSFRNVGRWIHDEERGHELEAEGDMDWREDDDNMILAPGQLKGFYTDLLTWAKPKPWFDKVTFDITASEKNWVSVLIKLN